MAGATEVRIAPARPTDLEPILALTCQTFETHYDNNPRAFPPPVLERLKQVHRDALNSDNSGFRTFAALQGDDLIGFLVLRSLIDAGMIYDIGVFPEARAKGFGLSLLRHAVSHGKDAGWRLLYGVVWDGNAASHALFKKAGFQAKPHPAPLLRRLFPKKRNTTYGFDL